MTSKMTANKHDTINREKLGNNIRRTVRAKRIDTLEWVFGYYCYNPHFDRHEVYSFDNDCSAVYQVIPETVCNCVNLQDMTRVETYEHDIICWGGFYFVVVWQHTKYVLKKDPDNECFDYTLSCFNGHEYRVVGNLYDNPEILRRNNP